MMTTPTVRNRFGLQARLGAGAIITAGALSLPSAAGASDAPADTPTALDESATSCPVAALAAAFAPPGSLPAGSPLATAVKHADEVLASTGAAGAAGLLELLGQLTAQQVSPQNETACNLHPIAAGAAAFTCAVGPTAGAAAGPAGIAVGGAACGVASAGATAVGQECGVK